MLSDLAKKVDGLIGEVKQVERESESIYLSLGKLFPSLAAETTRSSRVAERSLQGFTALGASSSNGEARAMRDFALESADFFKALREGDAAFLQRINESIERLSSLDSLIGGVRSDSEEMEIISLNAMTVALKSGNAGKAFSVITDELKRLSGRTIDLAEDITARGRTLLENFSRMRDNLRELDDFQKSFFEDLDRNLTQGFAELESDIKEAIRFFESLIEAAKTLKDPVQAIMQGVQLQDIIRQSLDHVAISLEEARSASVGADARSSQEDLAYIAAIAELSATLITDVVEKLDGSADSFGKNIESLKVSVEDMEKKRASFIGAAQRRGPRVDARCFSSDSTRYLELKKGVIGSARRLADQVRGLDESFKGLASLLSRFQNIVVASRIEIAKNKALQGVSTTVQGMITLTGRIESDVSGAMSTTKDFIKISVGAISSYSDAEGIAETSLLKLSASARSSCVEADPHFPSASADKNRGQALIQTLKRVEEDVETLARAASSVAEAIEGFILFTPEFLSLIASGQDELSRLLRLSEKLKRMRGELEELNSSARSVIGPQAAVAIESDRLKAMIERFTIFTHKKSAADIGNFHVEEGVEAGEVTLF